MGLTPSWGTKILQTVWCGQKINKNKIFIKKNPKFYYFIMMLKILSASIFLHYFVLLNAFIVITFT